MATDNLNELRQVLEETLSAPFASHPWRSARGRSHWVELEGWQDSLAGPLSTIAQTGGCEYVYLRDDWYFAGVNDPPALRQRMREWYAGLLAGIEQFSPASAEEAEDLAYMRSLAARIAWLIERANDLEQSRWFAERNRANEADKVQS
jgi:hypothetical protein